MKLNKKIITGIGGGILAVAVIVLVSAAGARKKEAAKHQNQAKMEFKNAPRPVRFERVKAAPLRLERSFPGIVKASEETALSFRVGGPLTSVNVMLGEPVKEGDLLMQIDPRDFEDRIAALEAQLSGAMAMQQNAQQDYKRISGLFEQKVVPQSDYDRAKSGLDAAEASVKSINAQLQMARHALDDTSLRAPYDGTVTEQLVENHEMVKSGNVVLRYHNIQTLEIVANIPENEVASSAAMKEGMQVLVSFPSLRGKSYEARLKEWSTKADPLTRTYASTFVLPAPEDALVLPGMTANVDVAPNRDQSLVITVPVSALVSDEQGGSSVWVYDEGKGSAALRNVVVGGLAGSSRVVVLKGLSEGDRVVVTGSRLLHDRLPLKTAAIR